MLTYLINVTDDMLAVSVIIGVIFAFIDFYCSSTGRVIIRIGLAFGIVVAGLRALITNTQRLVGGWKVGTYGYGVSLALFVLLILAFLVFGRSFFKKTGDEKKQKTAEIVICVLTALLFSAYLFCSLQNVFVYPFKFDTGGEGFLSSKYLLRLGGWLLGIVVCLAAAISSYKVAEVTAKKGYQKLVAAAYFALNIIYAVNNFACLMLVLTPRKIVNSTVLFNFAASSNNHSEWYTYASFIVVMIMAVLIWIRSYTSKEPYSTPAEHRKQRALWRTGKRYSILLLLCFICGILCATWFVKLNTVEIREAPVEEPQIIKDGTGTDSELRIPLEMVSDGHLHRFGYTTDDGYPTRLIVILKQENTTNFGIGLDACEICGEAGYYENNEGKVVCKKCGVVMNTSTIGLKGGCNPIIIDYDITDTYITIPVEEMVKNQSRFKK